ncbi:hypothetical protein [Erythrobacter sp.]|jgi:hypothetical protein|uniref:hypothetical protein n=1 Tax=Erythrobacter sp. TaxID=1042 RepID=UPI002EA66354|nr:hypothetical protein [Erythrobacter sp.]
MIFFRLIAACALPLTLAVPAEAEASDCPDPALARDQVEDTIHAFFDAVRLQDKAPLRGLVTETFYAFDVGKRFPGITLGDIISDALDAGLQINWNLGPMDTKVRCDVAWSQWENTGSVGNPPDPKPVRWLESAVLVYEGGLWKLDFFHSQRAEQN